MSIVVTAANGKLGTKVIEQLLAKKTGEEIIAGVRDPSKGANLGTKVVHADYSKPETLDAAFKGADKVLLISSNDVGHRLEHHQAAIAAAKKAGVKLIAYTSILHAAESKLLLAHDHQQTEKAIKESGIPYVFLRNGWYIENQTDSLANSIHAGAFIGASGNGKIAAATRDDFAAAAVAVLTTPGHENKIYELAGDTAYSAAELAAEVSKQLGKTLPYNDLPQDKYSEILQSFGLPKGFADVLADADANVAKGELEDSSGDLHRLIGRATTPYETVVKEALAALT